MNELVVFEDEKLNMMMTKYETKNIDYDLCHPDIADTLKKGQAILCRVWDSNKNDSRNEWVVAYLLMSEKSYRTELNNYKHAEPCIHSGYRVKFRNDLVKALINNGLTYDPESNSWRDIDGADTFGQEMFSKCGKRVKMINGYWRCDGIIFDERWLEKM